MKVTIRKFSSDDMKPVVQLSLVAWEPVFEAWQRLLGPTLYPLAIYENWQMSQQEVVERICSDPANFTWVAEIADTIVGFVSYSLNDDSGTGEVQLIAVSPDHQGNGIGSQLNRFALQKMKDGGMKLAVAGTGGDEGHAAARRSYEKAGYTGLPLVRYYKAL